MQKTKRGPEQMASLFRESGLRLSKRQREQFWTFHQLLRKRNEELDLTRLHSFDGMVVKLYVDSAIVATLVELPSPLLDLGSGAGFPGIPLKIMRPDLHVVLAEPRAKRVRFLQEAIDALQLDGIEVFPHRIGARFDRRVRCVITRAVETIPKTLARLVPWLEDGTRVAFMKGPSCQPEIDAARREYRDLFRVTDDRSYSIASSKLERRLVVLERVEAAAELDAGGGAGAAHAGSAARASAGTEHTGGAPLTGGAAERKREIRRVESTTSNTFKQLRALHGSRGIRKANLALVGGARYVDEIVRDFPERCAAWIASAELPPPEHAPQLLAWYQLPARLLHELDPFGTGAPLLLVRVPQLPTWTDDDWPSGCTLFLPFQDPENVGAVLRSAAAFGVARVVLLKQAAHPFHPRAVRAAGGSSVFRVPLFSGPSIDALEVHGAPLIALSPSGQDLGGFGFPPAFGLLSGMEGPGLPEATATSETLRIPMAAGSESLNAATATAIALYLWNRGREREQKP